MADEPQRSTPPASGFPGRHLDDVDRDLLGEHRLAVVTRRAG